MNGRIPILEEIIKYNKEDNLILSMPGNKCGKGFSKDYIGREFLEKMGYLDITEVEPLDNLHHPQGIIKESIELLRKYYDAYKAYFLVNGSTEGNLISIFSAFEEGDHVLIERNCHKSIYNALILKKLKVSYIKGRIDKEKDIFLPPTKKDIEEAIDKNKDVKGIILTYPNYFGVCYDIKDLILELKNKKIKTIIDSAHGAHFNCSESLPKSLTSVADYVILSAHKTIPSLTQGAYLIVNEKNSKVDFYFNALTSTSPSYLLLASLDYGRYYMEVYGEKDYEELIHRCEKWKSKIEKLRGIHIYGEEDLKDGYLIDKTRYTIFLKKEYSGELLLEYLRKEKIQCEMSFSRGVVLLFSTFHKDEEFEKVYKALEKLNLEDIKQKVSSKSRFIQEIPNKKYEPFEMLDKEYIEVEINEKLVSKITKEHIVPYPPGIPLLCPGEEVTEEIIEIILAYLDEKRDIIGIENRKIKIIGN
ncbi:aminotransferase class I/II-fold pyridoxal phosphate-dependent enzyme [uncultured Clostridium sp.]|uniref:aminotransferase class I/II-fold pyridoxal phosphate-dependent enzyme n=1 Tax=uncultured Clostridium sp. TaxID=59620 RepID=UPI00260EB709|nr:aminotransferase class I/II-fold pyridoxal phosphate-dependent enzyme [uncultured Clostridium sp.]